MAKTIVIKGANYSDNKLDTVSWGEGVPCTAIELNKSSTEIKCGNTETLTATPTPSNTTDSISWASSDESVATVSNGVVTAVGLGNATITVTCGSQSDTCDVTAIADINTENAVKLAEYRIAKIPLSTGANGFSSLSSSDIRGSIFSSTGTYPIQKTTVGDYTPKAYKLPNNTTHIKITVPSGVTIDRIAWYNSGYTKDWDGVTVTSEIGLTDSFSMTGNVMQMAIPSFDTYPEIDSLIVSFRNGDAVFTDSIFENISVEFLHIDE